MTKQIPLSQGLFALVDADDYDYLMQWKWYAAKNSRNGQYYARRMEPQIRKLIYMHRVITNAPDGLQPDHINHDGLDNRRCNLRVVTQKENNQNRRIHSKTGFKGVKQLRKTSRYFAQIPVNGKHIYLGLFQSPEEAARAYDEAAKKYLGEYKYINFPEVQK